ncbi:MAG TPA: hypothetical protein DCS07_17400 [Bdellovibrionales bacterium]|nr:MAG: hypothetical protein A2Z97_15710 [Bdellovibrionales bacterium GWB1_52_6]OFZ02935.1 MAG: hypothetical protein A2X97_05015 [Bdellovibrionales bacterium GWA1_52_35]HAR44377.1 hypothetical protein [Bdellovibrionales bacterium]HCM38520.1 hypothetical protein [Bdellovibrionales bacterium]
MVVPSLSITSDFRKAFDLDPALIYLNSGTFSISPRMVLKAQIEYQKDFERNPTASLMEAWGRVWRIQKLLAEYFNTVPENLFLRPNVTAAMNDFISQIPLPRGTEIATTDLEYGAIVNICRARAEKDKFTLRTISVPASANHTDELVSHIVEQLNDRTALLMISHIMTGTGLILPLKELAAELRKRDIILAVDGAHGPGALPLDFNQLLDLDFYGGNLHKWFLGPKGTAFGWVNPRHHEALDPLYTGWTTYEPAPPAFRNFAPGSHFARKMLHSACQNFGPYFALEDSLRYWTEMGAASIYSELKRLQTQLESKIFAKTGWKSISPSDPALRGPLLTYVPPGLHVAEAGPLMENLRSQHGLQVAIPGIKGVPCLRLSPHIYNTDEELERAVTILASVFE